MKRVLIALAVAAAGLPVWAQTNVGVSVQVNQPGLYGRIDIGQVAAPPVVVYQQPVVIVPPTAVAVQQHPIYLHVPPGHAKNWAKHCGRYNACGQPVYFVREDWYQQQYVPARRHHDEDHDHEGHGHGHGKHKD
jgi:hypothetical protein